MEVNGFTEESANSVMSIVNEIKPGVVAGFDIKSEPLFLIGLANRITGGFEKNSRGLKLEREGEQWTFYSDGKILALYPSFWKWGELHGVSHFMSEEHLRNIWGFGEVYVGREQIRNALEADPDFNYYAGCVDRGSLVLGGGLVWQVTNKFLRGGGLQALMPNPVRYKKNKKLIDYSA